MTYDLVLQFTAVWFLLGIPVLIAVVWSIVKWRRHKLMGLAMISLLTMVAVGALWPLTWKMGYATCLGWQNPKGDGDIRSNHLSLIVSHGAIELTKRVQDNTEPYPFGDKYNLAIYHGPNGGRGRLFSDDVSITKSDFLQKTLGFQVCWARFPESPGANTRIGVYSITLPHWFVLLLCPICPLLWWRRHYRRCRLSRLRDGLCLACGYDLRASPVRCPECGTPTPATQPLPAQK